MTAFDRRTAYLGTKGGAIYKAYRDLTAMMSDRKYSLTPEDHQDLELNLEEWTDKFLQRARSVAEDRDRTFETQLRRIYYPLEEVREEMREAVRGEAEPYLQLEVEREMEDPKDIIYVFFIHTEGEKEAKSLTKNIFSTTMEMIMTIPNCNHIILLSEMDKISTEVLKLTTELPGKRFEFFSYSELAYNPSKHVLQDRFVKLSLQERRMLLKEITDSDRNASFSNLPIMFNQEKMAKWLGAVPGDVIEIISNNIGVDILVDSSLIWVLVVAGDIPKDKKTKKPKARK